VKEIGNRKRTIQEKLDKIGKCLEVWASSSLGIITAFKKCKTTEKVSVVSKRASSTVPFLAE
jgi:hypothetical protein